MAHRPTVVDLFSGCGGFGLGAEMAGFHTSVAVDIDADLQSSYRLNFPNTKVLQSDVAQLDEQDWSSLLPDGAPDGVIGGPPCQGFSRIGKRSSDDQRNSLVFAYYRQINILKPRFFIMENVEGILDNDNLQTLNAAISLVANTYNVFGPRTIDAADFGAPTRRKRIVVVGIRKDERAVADGRLLTPTGTSATVFDAISDLPSPTASSDFAWARLSKNLALSPYAERARRAPPDGVGWTVAKQRHGDGYVSGFLATTHTQKVTDRFAALSPGEVDRISKYPRLSWTGKCPTLRAGTGRDHGSFQAARPVHPEHARVITVREAARLQGFPDWFVFHPTKWHSFRMIGNSVSPHVSESLLSRIAALLELDRVTSAVA